MEIMTGNKESERREENLVAVKWKATLWKGLKHRERKKIMEEDGIG